MITLNDRWISCPFMARKMRIYSCFGWLHCKNADFSLLLKVWRKMLDWDFLFSCLRKSFSIARSRSNNFCILIIRGSAEVVIVFSIAKGHTQCTVKRKSKNIVKTKRRLKLWWLICKRMCVAVFYSWRTPSAQYRPELLGPELFGKRKLICNLVKFL